VTLDDPKIVRVPAGRVEVKIIEPDMVGEAKPLVEGLRHRQKQRDRERVQV